MNYTLEDLFFAYRKAKFDAFYESGHPMKIAFAKYEQKLLSNLKTFLREINTFNIEYFKDPEFLGTYDLVLKSLKIDQDPTNTFYSNGFRSWDVTTKIEGQEFRVIGRHSVEFHILCSLWIDKVGQILENCLSDNSYGCRIKRTVPDRVNSSNKEYDKHSLGHFNPYFRDYKKWQKNGLDTIESVLKDGKKVIAITSDVEKFYYNICPQFLLRPTFYYHLGLDESYAQNDLTHLLVQTFTFWNEQIKKDIRSNYPNEIKNLLVADDYCGIPVGVSASKVIANLVLDFFDKKIEQELLPIYYGRYVDDIFIVIRDNGQIRRAEDFWSFARKRIKEINQEKDGNIIEMPYAEESRIKFTSAKQKTFILEGNSGEVFIQSIKNALDENSSEWRLLPDNENDISSMSEQLSSAQNGDGDSVLSLRQTDSISIQRQKFIIHLRNVEIAAEILPITNSSQSAERFIELCSDYIFTPERLEIYQKYYPRIVKLAFKIHNVALAESLLQKIKESWDAIRGKLSGENVELIASCQRTLNSIIAEAVICSLVAGDLGNEERKTALDRWLMSEEVNKATISLLLNADLHDISYKKQLLEAHSDGNLDLRTTIKGFCDWSSKQFPFFFNEDHYEDSNRGPDRLRRYYSLFFSIRPFCLAELTYLFQDWTHNIDGAKNIEEYLNVFKESSIDLPKGNIEHSSQNNSKDLLVNISVPNKEGGLRVHDPHFALTSFLTSDKSWKANVAGYLNEPDEKRYERLFRIINDIIKCRRHHRIDYVVFPELSIPRFLMFYVANKLHQAGISLIAGSEYENLQENGREQLPDHIKKLVSNQLQYFLTIDDGTAWGQVVIRQEKVIPAFYEEHELYQIGGKWLAAESEAKYIIDHDGFVFSGLICNDLLNIDYRQQLRGKIDALIIVEWNKDVNSYDALVKSTSLDLHCFVIQVNNRKYGDTRLRVPAKEDFERDKVRVRGGDLDYFVVSTLNVKELRDFQSTHRSDPNGNFKPVPTGYLMWENRRAK